MSADLEMDQMRDRVRVAHTVWCKAMTRVSRCRRPESIEAARIDARDAEAVYRAISAERDKMVQQRARRARVSR